MAGVLKEQVGNQPWGFTQTVLRGFSDPVTPVPGKDKEQWSPSPSSTQSYSTKNSGPFTSSSNPMRSLLLKNHARGLSHHQVCEQIAAAKPCSARPVSKGKPHPEATSPEYSRTAVGEAGQPPPLPPSPPVTAQTTVPSVHHTCWVWDGSCFFQALPLSSLVTVPTRLLGLEGYCYLIGVFPFAFCNGPALIFMLCPRCAQTTLSIWKTQ